MTPLPQPSGVFQETRTTVQIGVPRFHVMRLLPSANACPALAAPETLCPPTAASTRPPPPCPEHSPRRPRGSFHSGDTLAGPARPPSRLYHRSRLPLPILITHYPVPRVGRSPENTDLGSALGGRAWDTHGVGGYRGTFAAAPGPARTSRISPELEELAGLEGIQHDTLSLVEGVAARPRGMVGPSPRLLSRPCTGVLTRV